MRNKIIQSLVLLTLTACSSGTGTVAADAEVETRTGSKVTSKSIEDFNGKPVISDDGKSALYISGRSKTLKAYKYSFDGVASLFNDTDLGSEKEAMLSPDGLKVILHSVKDGVSNLYYRPFEGDGSVSVSQLTDDTKVERQVSFSSDSSLVAYVSSEVGELKSSIYVASVTSSSAIETPVAISSGEFIVSSVVWQKASSGYVLVALVLDQTTGSHSLYRYTFSDISTATSATVDSTLTGISFSRSQNQIVTTTAGFYFTKAIASFGSTKRAPDGDQSSDITFPIRSDLSYLIIDGTQTSMNYTGYDLNSLSINTAGDFLALSDKEYFDCETGVYGNGVLLMNAAGDLTRVMPFYSTGSDTKVWSVGTNVCTRLDSAEKAIEPDLSMTSLALAGTASSTAYTLIYTTIYSGTPVIRAVTLADGTHTFYEVSASE